jgi:hypothetical protein
MPSSFCDTGIDTGGRGEVMPPCSGALLIFCASKARFLRRRSPFVD